MAIQLNERDHLIFKLIEEHQVLLEKHISWFISTDEKPVLIRDRLRKLFYLDYLLCERHKDLLPWWTTPTKPLVYMLSPMTRDLIAVDQTELDLMDSVVQRHFLEIANIRMLFLVDEKERSITALNWKTINRTEAEIGIDAQVSFVRDGKTCKLGILNHPAMNTAHLLSSIDFAQSKLGVEDILIISRDGAHQMNLQQIVSTGEAKVIQHVAFATHQELYKAGSIKTKMRNAENKPIMLWQIPFAQISSVKESIGSISASNLVNPWVAGSSMANSAAIAGTQALSA